MSDKLIQPQPCAGCGDAFTPTRDDRKYCSKSCASRARAPRGQLLAAAVAARRAQKTARVQALFAARFGTLSARESEMLALALEVGYDRGYHVGYHKRPAPEGRTDASA